MNQTDGNNEVKPRAKRKATKKLTDITFEHEGAAVALVGPAVGGPANSANIAVVIKSLHESDESIKDESDSNSTNASVEKSVEPSGSLNNNNKENNMADKEQVAPEMIEKSQFESLQKSFDEQKVALQKALDDQKEELQKALAVVAQYEAEKKEALVKAKSAQISAIVKDEKIAEPLIKACLKLESEDDFGAFVAAVDAMMKSVTTSEMFMEKGFTTQEQEVKEESRVAQLLKAQFSK